METQERIVCRICLKICDKFKALDGDTRGVLDTILPNIKLTSIKESVMCTNCTEMLFKCFDFKVKCIYTHDYIVPFINNKNTVKLDLKDVYLSKNKNSTGVPEDQDICGFCLASVKSCYPIFLCVEKGNVMLEKMIRQCLPELDLSIIKKPVICSPCRSSLEICSHFVMNCLSVEDKIKKYCQALDVNSINQIKLGHLLEFTMSTVTADEADGNLVDIIKVEKQVCEERTNVGDMDNMMFKNEEGFVPENVLACKEESKNFDMIKVEGEEFCEEDSLKEENLEKMEDQNVLLKEEIEIKTEESDFYRLEDDVVLPRSEVTTGLCVRFERLIPNLEGELSKPHIKRKLTNKNVSRILMYKCDSCSYQTRSKYNLKNHSVKHKDPSEITMYKCDSCCFQTKYKQYFSQHLLVHKHPSEITMHKCDSCSYQTIHKGKLNSHSLKHKDSSEVTVYKCNSCAFESKYKRSLNHHSLKHKDPADVTMYKCGYCPYQTKIKNILENHLLTHMNPMYKCNSCSFQTRHKVSLRRHGLTYSHILSEATMSPTQDPADVTVYKCDYCPYQTKIKNTFENHLLTHMNPMYKCNSCSFQTKHKASLRRHGLAFSHT